MVRIPVVCPYCHDDQVVKRGKTDTGKQRCRCHNHECDHQSFLLDPAYKGRLPKIKQQVIKMSLIGSGVRNTARVLQISTATVILELKKRTGPHLGQYVPRKNVTPDEVEVSIDRVKAAEVDEMWSFVGMKREPHWLWYALDHRTGNVSAYVFGRRQDEVFLQLKALLQPFGITRFFTDHWGAYARHLATDAHAPGSRNTQQIERKHLT